MLYGELDHMAEPVNKEGNSSNTNIQIKAVIDRTASDDAFGVSGGWWGRGKGGCD